jgi:hypothetical protein
MSIEHLTALGNAWGPFLMAAATGLFGWLIARERRLAGDRDPTPAAQLADPDAKPKRLSIRGPVALLIVGSALGWFFQARPLLVAKMAVPRSPDMYIDAGIDFEAACDAASCEKKSGCKCVGGSNGSCNCNAVEKKPQTAPDAVTPPVKPTKKPPKKPESSSLARALPKMAGELEPPWFANLPPSTEPLAPQL